MLLLYPCLYAKLLYTHTHTQKIKKYIYMLHLAGHVWLTFTVESLVQRTWLVIIKWITWYLVVAIRVHSNEQTHAHLSWNSLKIVTADCGHPPVFLNGTVSYHNTTEESEAHYHCDDGFTLEGEMTAVCRADGRWSFRPVCRPLTGSMLVLF